MNITIIIISVVLMLLCSADAAPAASAGYLRAEYLDAPLGIDNPAPILSWRMESDRRGALQKAYQVQVATSAELLGLDQPDMWDSGRVESGDSTAVRYGGKPLVSRATYMWRVRVWDEQGEPSQYSAPASFEMALLAPADWSARWIGVKELSGGEGSSEPSSAVPMLRREFSLDKPAVRARAYVTGLGYYELCINGERVGDHVLDPPYTSFDSRVYYSVYDVSDLLSAGANCVGALIGQAWWRKGPRFLLQLEIDHADGARTTVISDDGWKWSLSPITDSTIYHGETYDARLEQPGWDAPGFDDGGWKPVDLIDVGDVELSAQTIQPIKVVETLEPKSLASPTPGVWVFDMGQNFSGWCRLTATGEAGTQIKMRHAELTYPDGAVNQENLRSARATDTFVLKGDGREVFEPRFTYHGFRYVQVEGYPGEPTLDSIRGRVVHTAFEQRGEFVCSNQLLNQVQQACLWGQRTNFHAIPTDCPQRDERQGWMGDAHISAYAMCYNFDMRPAYGKFLRDIQDAQRDDGAIPDTVPHIWGSNPGDPMWAAAYPLILWYTYLHTGDISLLEQHYDGVKRYVEMLRREAGDSRIITRNNYGDWIALVETPGDLISTGAFILVTDCLIKIARTLGGEDDVEEYTRLRGAIADAFNARFFDRNTRNYGNASQLSNALPLHLGIVPPEYEQAVLDNLVRDIVDNHHGHLSTGFVGTPVLMSVLSARGRADLAYTIASQPDYPGWGYMIANGATTIWELWRLETGPGMNSHNHPPLGFVSGWFHEVLAGLVPDPDGAGWRRFTVRPHVVGDLTWAKSRLETMRGAVESDWKLTGEGLRLAVTIPAGSAATVCVPRLAGPSVQVLESGRPVWLQGVFTPADGITDARDTGDWIEFQTGSGSYVFDVTQVKTAARPD